MEYITDLTDTIYYAIEMYGHLCYGCGEVNGEQLADMIEKHYNCKTSAINKVSADVVRKYVDVCSYNGQMIRARLKTEQESHEYHPMGED